MSTEIHLGLNFFVRKANFFRNSKFSRHFSIGTFVLLSTTSAIGMGDNAMGRKIPDSKQIDQLNTLVDALRGIMGSGEPSAEFETAMKAQIRKQIDIIHAKPIYASHKTHIVDGKEVPTYWYTPKPDNYSKKLTAPTKEKLYDKLMDYYTGRGYQIGKKGKKDNSEYSLRKIFETYMERDISITAGSKKSRLEVWNLYLEGSPLADMDIRDITAANIMNTYRDIFAQGPVKGTTFTKRDFADIHGCVHAVYKYAITYMDLNLMDIPKTLNYTIFPFRPTNKGNDDIMAESLTRDEFARAITWCRQNSDDGPSLAIWFNLYLGLRYAELVALRWCDVDIWKKQVHVCGHIDEDRNRQPYTKKKTAEGFRYLPLIDDASKVFMLIMSRRPKDAADDSLIFPLNGYSTYLRRCKDCFRFALQTDKLPEHYTPHSLRATAASMWYVNGVSEKTIQSLLGHTTIQMTMRYCHDLTTMDEKRNAMALAMAVNS